MIKNIKIRQCSLPILVALFKQQYMNFLIINMLTHKNTIIHTKIIFCTKYFPKISIEHNFGQHGVNSKKRK